MGSLDERMTELADAVRLKSGATGDMTIKQMITAMAGITVADDIGFTCGTITANSTGSLQEIEHGLGHAPGAVLFMKKGASESSISSSSSSSYLYEALLSIVFGEDSGHCYCYNSVRKTTTTSGSSSYTIGKTWSNNSSVPSTMFGTDLSVASYYVTNINETSFKTPTKLIANDTYFWIAFRAPLL